MEESKKCIKCKRIIPDGQKAKMGLCPMCFDEVGTVGVVLGAGGLVCGVKKLVKNGPKIAKTLSSIIKK